MAFETNDKVHVTDAHDAHANAQALPNLDGIKFFQEQLKPTADTSNLHSFTIDGLDEDHSGAKKAAKPSKEKPAEPKHAGAPAEAAAGKSHDKTTAKPAEAPKPKSGPADLSSDKPVGKTAPAGAQLSENEIVKKTGDDVKAPTVAFVDEFKKKDIDLGDGTKVAHGEISRAAAEANKLNTVALQNNGNTDSNGDQDFSKTINDVAKKIDAGELKLGRGDALNMSLGNNDPSFEEFNKFLGVPADKAITRDNLTSKKDDIIARLKDIGQDPTRPAADRVTAQRIVNTNQAIDNIKAKGIEVVHAAGNLKDDGIQRFSPDFMSATDELSSVKPSGRPDSFSASNSLTKGANGVFPVHARDDLDMLSPTPVADQTGSLEIGDTGVKFPRTGNNVFLADNRVFNRENFENGKTLPSLTADQKPFDPSFLSPETALKAGTIDPSRAVPGITESNSLSAPLPKNVTHSLPGKPLGQELTPGDVPAVGYVDGTSFANIDFFQRNFDRLKALKAGN